MNIRVLPPLIAAFILAAPPARAQVSAFIGGDHMSIGKGSYTGIDAGAGWRGLELGYRNVHGQGAQAQGGSADLYWRWHYYFVTAGASYLDVNENVAGGWQVAPRIGAGMQFGPLRAAIRYERFNHADGLSLSIGLSVRP